MQPPILNHRGIPMPPMEPCPAASPQWHAMSSGGGTVALEPSPWASTVAADASPAGAAAGAEAAPKEDFGFGV